MFKSLNVKTVPPANFPRPKPPGQGRNTLITKEEVLQGYKDVCIKYVNDKIQDAYKKGQRTVNLDTGYLNFGLMAEIEKEYTIVHGVHRCQYCHGALPVEFITIKIIDD
ncbi:hypothetical protein EXQ37_18275 [Clostridium botulinum]|nr:hypothetical protein [Clostridium botulinum]MBO0561542.1 hypothetical protein [Clostridium botulinum]